VQKENYIIPRHLDDPPMFFMWDMDEALAFLVPFMFLLLYGMVFVGVVSGLLAMRFFGKIKAMGGKQLAKHILYWYTPAEAWFRLKRTPPSYIREFIG
jgi:conjugal transfer pilus assembly protein TraL